MLPKAVLDAIIDPELTPDDANVFTFLHYHLTYDTYRPIKQTWLRRTMRRSRESISRALTRLVAQGYLERKRERGSGLVAYYRIPVSPRD